MDRHATAEPVQTLDAGWDMAAIGEGQSTLLSLVDAKGDPAGITGLAYRDAAGNVKRTGKAKQRDLDDFPGFALTWDRFNALEITRGCVYACRFKRQLLPVCPIDEARSGACRVDDQVSAASCVAKPEARLYGIAYNLGGVMKVITASDLRANLANVFDAIEDDAEDLVVTRSGHEPLVVMRKSEYDAWRETEYLSRGANGRELRRRMAEMEAGEGVVRELIGDDAEPRR
ncbi:type II toxin-antitoxin system prevent-host-death family antitoxin [Actinoplanes siamensis]|uniref:Antitoxin n=1 Tax=Actinoplanes siamensis TaxID=1223317 RepID=A0A919NDN9_9ACTN|nr:type II toxin-antitoxin system prevent-host-death family antitoxin [Actinoplanes siamensis]GIF08912.1 hypothetical protein Asi03nite_64500 [Actinoplanes siamensis]